MAKLYFRYGAMNCGKTTSLLQVAHNYEEKGMKILLIKPASDKKGDKKIVSRLGIDREVDILLKEDETLKNVCLDGIRCILVDEVQFMTEKQIKELWIITKLKNIPVICYGLKTNFKGKLFSGTKSLIEVADELDELITICKCGKRAKFNARIVDGKYVKNGSEIAIDGFDNVSYESLCGKCYIEEVLGIKH